MRSINRDFALILGFVFCTVGLCAQPTDYVVHYPFDGDANDMSESTINGTVVGAAPALDRFEDTNSAYYFDGSDYIDVGSSSVLELGQYAGYTISLWFKPDDANPEEPMTILSKYSSTDDRRFYALTLGSESSNNLRFTIYDNGAAFNLNALEYSCTTEWHHLLISSDGEDLKMYLDNILVSEKRITTNMKSDDTSTHFVFGAKHFDSDWWDEKFEGFIDDVRIYNRKVSESERSALFLEGTGLIAYYPMDGNTKDYSGNSNDGVASGAIMTTDRFGNENGAYLFDGIDDRIEIPNDASLELQEFSIAAWIKADKSTGAILSMSEPPTGNRNSGYYLSLQSGELQCLSNKSSEDWATVSYNADLSLDSWHLVIYTFDGETLSLYLDGEQVATFEDEHEVNYDEHNPVNIGAFASSTGGAWFEGRIDDVRIYDKVISTQIIKGLYTGASGLTAYYPLSGNANDYSGYENHGATHDVTEVADRFGLEGNAYNFNGISQYIDLGDEAGNNLRTISFWFQTNEAISENTNRGTFGFVVRSIAQDTDTPYEFSVAMAQGKIRFRITDEDAETHEIFSTKNSWETSGWHHVVAMVDETEGMKLYIDRVLQLESDSYSGSTGSHENITALGRWGERNFSYFNGKMDDVRFYDRAISEVEISELYDLPELEEPQIAHVDVEGIYLIGSGGLAMRATVVDDVKVKDVNINYKTNSATTFKSESMSLSGGHYGYTFEDSDFGDLGIEFYVTATDEDNNEKSSLVYVIQLNQSGNTEVIPHLKSSADQLDYSIIAIPYEEVSVGHVLTNFNGYEGSNWKLATYIGARQYRYHPVGFSLFEPGKGYWFLTSESVNFLLKGSHSVNATYDKPFVITTLANDWTMIGNPYPFAIDWQDVINHNANNGVFIEGIVTFEDRQFTTDKTILDKFQGALIYSQQVTQIEIPISAKLGGGRLKKSVKQKNNLQTFGNGNWDFGIEVRNESLSYDVARIGMKEEIDFDKAREDWKLVPRLSKYLDISFEGELARSKVPLDSKYAWKFTVNSNLNETTTLSWDNTGLQNSDYGLMLLDVVNQKVVDMTKRSSYTFDMEGEQHPFRLAYGGKDELTDLLELQSSFIGEPYPNPFHNAIHIPIAIPNNNSIAFVQVFDVLGKQIGDFFYRDLTAGYHEISIDGLANNINLKPGSYLIQITVETDKNLSTEHRRVVYQ